MGPDAVGGDPWLMVRAGEAVLLGCWLVLAALALRSARHVGRTALPDVALAALALALRLGLAPLTPEIRFRLEYAWSDRGLSDIEKYGLGWPFLMRVVVTALGGDYALPFVTSAVLGAASVFPMVGLARALGAPPADARWAGFALAVTPLLVWFGHTDSPFAADAFFTLLTLWATARYVASDPSAGRVWLAVAVCALVSTAQMRVESVATGLVAALLAVARYDRFPWRRPDPWLAAVAAAILLIPHVGIVGERNLQEWSRRSAEDSLTLSNLVISRYIFLNPTLQAGALIAAGAVGLAVGRVSWRLRLWAAASMVLVATNVLDVNPTETAFSVARYQLRALPFAALLAGLGAGWLAARPRVGPLLGAAVVAGAAAGLPIAATVSVLKTEHDFVRAHLRDVPDGCTIMSWMLQGDTTLAPPVHLSAIEGLDHTWLDITRDPAPEDGRCLVYYQSGGCTCHYQFAPGHDGPRHPTCEAFEARWTLDPIATAELAADPVGPMGIRNRLPGAPIPVGFYRMTPRE